MFKRLLYILLYVAIAAAMVGYVGYMVYSMITGWKEILEGVLLIAACFFVLAFIVQWPYDEKASIMKKFLYTLANTTLELVKIIASLWPNRAKKEERAESGEDENPSHSLAEEELPSMSDVPEVIPES